MFVQCVDVVLVRLPVLFGDEDRVSPAVAVDDVRNVTKTGEYFALFELFVAVAAEIRIVSRIVV